MFLEHVNNIKLDDIELAQWTILEWMIQNWMKNNTVDEIELNYACQPYGLHAVREWFVETG